MKARLLAVVCVLLSMPVWAQEVKVDIKAFMFGPKDLNVAVGTKVTWVNDDEIPHTWRKPTSCFAPGRWIPVTAIPGCSIHRGSMSIFVHCIRRCWGRLWSANERTDVTL